jgi:hypothetical protein
VNGSYMRILALPILLSSKQVYGKTKPEGIQAYCWTDWFTWAYQGSPSLHGRRSSTLESRWPYTPRWTLSQRVASTVGRLWDTGNENTYNKNSFWERLFWIILHPWQRWS